MKARFPWKILAALWALIGVYLFTLQSSTFDIPQFVYSENLYLLCFVSNLSLTIFFYRHRTRYQRQWLLKAAAYGALLAAFPLVYLPAVLLWPDPYLSQVSVPNLVFYYLIFLGADISFVVGGELFFSILGRWNTMRRRSMTLMLTQTFSLIVLAVPMLVLLASILFNIFTRQSTTSYAYTPPQTIPGKFFILVATQIFPLTGITAGAGVAAVALALPFVFLISWVIARHYTRRLKNLVETVHQMKNGNLSVRVAVQGEDEISRLSSDFNEMAETLELSQSELLRKQEKISALLDSQKEWLLKISHELRTPVTTLKALLESTADQPQAALAQSAVLQQEVDGLHRLIEDLFTLTQSEHAQLSLQMAPFQLPQQLLPLLTPLKQFAWETKQIELIQDLQADACVIQVDAMRLAQVLRNLVHNAIRHTPQGGLICVETRSEESQFHLRVRDTGEGIPPDLLEKIWKPFQKHPRSNGAGIGLTLSKELVESMNGSIQVSSDAQQGTCFCLTFPRVAEKTAAI